MIDREPAPGADATGTHPHPLLVLPSAFHVHLGPFLLSPIIAPPAGEGRRAECHDGVPIGPTVLAGPTFESVHPEAREKKSVKEKE